MCRDPRAGTAAEREQALLAYAAKLTTLAEPMAEADLGPLRAVGLADEDIRDLAQVVAYFAYVNRHVEGLGISLEPGHPGRRFAEIAMESDARVSPHPRGG